MDDDGKGWLILPILAILCAAAIVVVFILAVLHASNQDRTNHGNFTRECITAGKQVISGNCVAAK